MNYRWLAVPVLLLLVFVNSGSRIGTASSGAIRFKKIVLDKEFRSEGVAVADVNRDGKPDVIAGNLWYEAPDWTSHEIAPVQKFDAAKAWSNSFINFAADINQDGWSDLIRVDMPGTHNVIWHENPQRNGLKQNAPWPQHTLARNACNESPALATLFNAGKNPVLIFSLNDSQMHWFEPNQDRGAEFIAHPISEKIAKDKAKDHGVWRYSHGLGVGDLNGDGRNDVLIKSGYWEAPPDPRTPDWKFVPTNLGEDCAQMYVLDVNGDGLNDIISSSAHNIGVWWHEQRKGANGNPEFIRHTIDDSFSQSHSLMLADLNGDGKQDIITGKRFWAHGPAGDVNPNDPAMLYWYEFTRKQGQVKWVRHEIDNDSGVGTQFVVADLNNDKRPDVVTSNKKGVFVFLQTR